MKKILNMKKNLLLGGVLLCGTLSAQIKGVGVAISEPTETLHVEGTTRIIDLPENEKGKIHTYTEESEDGKKVVETSTAKDKLFKATKTIVADDNGVLGTVSGLPSAPSGKYENTEISNTEVFIPEKRCAKNVIGDGATSSGSRRYMDFEKAGYRFSWFDAGGGKVQVDVQRIGEYINQVQKAKVTTFSPYITAGDKGDIKIGFAPVELVSMSFHTSNSGKVTLIIAGTAQTFHIDLTTLNPETDKNATSKDKVMGICIEQTVF